MDRESDDSLHMPGVRYSTVGGNIVAGLLVELVASVGILSCSYALLVNVCFLVKVLPWYLFGKCITLFISLLPHITLFIILLPPFALI